MDRSSRPQSYGLLRRAMSHQHFQLWSERLPRRRKKLDIGGRYLRALTAALSFPGLRFLSDTTCLPRGQQQSLLKLLIRPLRRQDPGLSEPSMINIPRDLIISFYQQTQQHNPRAGRAKHVRFQRELRFCLRGVKKPASKPKRNHFPPINQL